MLERNKSTKRVTPNGFKPSIVYSQSLPQIIEKYLAVCVQLNQVAEEVPGETNDIDALIAREQSLFDKHATLLNDALSMDIRSLDDVKAIMQLWRNEVVGDRHTSQLNASNKIVLSVCKYLEAN